MHKPFALLLAAAGFALEIDLIVRGVVDRSPVTLAAVPLVVVGAAAAFAFLRRGAFAALGAVPFAGVAFIVALSGIIAGALDDPAALAPSGFASGTFALFVLVAGCVSAVAVVVAAWHHRLLGGVAALLALVVCGSAIASLFDPAPDALARRLPWMFAPACLVTLLGIAGAISLALRSRSSRALAIVALAGFAALLQALGLEAAGDGLPSPLAFERGIAPTVTPADAVATLADYVPPGRATSAASTATGQQATIAGIGDASPAATQASASPTAPAVDAFEAGIAAGRAQLARADLDVAALAATLPNDPAAIDRYVRDAIALDAYPGALRGATGALLARAGNDDDRAALLIALLAQKHLSARLVRANVGDAEIAELSTRVRRERVDLDASATTPEVSSSPLPSSLDARSADALARRHAAAEVARLDGDLRASETIAHRLLVAAAAAGKPANVDPSQTWPSLLRSHTWVQVQTASGTWSDLDPSLARLEPGAHLGGAPTPLDAFDASEIWRATLRLVADYPSGTSTLATASAAVADLGGRSITARLVPVGVEDPATFDRATTFRPEIVGALTAQGAPLDANTVATLRALRLEIDVVAPGGAIATYRRTLAGAPSSDPLARAAQLAQQVAVIVVPGAENVTYLTSRWLASVHALRPQLARLAGDAGIATPLANDASLFPEPLAELAARDDAASLALARDGARLFRDRPGIYLERSAVTIDRGSRRMQRVFDIVEDGMSAVGPGAANANAARGVYMTHAEQTLDSAARRVGMLQVDEDARAAGAPLLALAKSADRARLDAVDANATANLDETFAHGEIALAYDRLATVDGAPAYGWWTLDASGNALGRMTGGGGQESEEYLLTNEIPEQIMNAWDVNQITDNCLGEGATTSSCAGELCDSFASVPGEKALGAGLDAFLGGAIIGQVDIETKMLGKIAGEVGTNATTGNLCQAGYEYVNGPAQRLTF